MFRKTLVIAAVTPFLWACEGTTSPSGPGQVAVRFGTTASAAGAAATGGDWRPSLSHAASPNAITVTGDNGTLVIDDIQFIVSEIELERVGADCVLEQDDDGCAEFEGGPYLVRLLDGSPVDLVAALIPAGTYDEFEFEVENLNIDDDDDDSEQQAKTDILASLQSDYPGFPSRGSMVVHGSFEGTPFTVYLDAEIEIEREFDTPFRVPEDGAIAVQLDPTTWFRTGSQVIDLSAYDGQTIELEIEFESGITSIDSDDD